MEDTDWFIRLDGCETCRVAMVAIEKKARKRRNLERKMTANAEAEQTIRGRLIALLTSVFEAAFRLISRSYCNLQASTLHRTVSARTSRRTCLTVAVQPP